MILRNISTQWLICTLCTITAAGPLASSRAAAAEPAGTTPTLGRWLGGIPAKFTRYDVVAVPDKDEPEWWCGAPSVVRDDDGTFWLAARMRTTDAPLGQRGYEIRIFRSDDGETFKPVGHPARPVLDLTGWHSHAVRPAGVVPLGVGYLFIYEGSDALWNDPVYNIATGLGFTFDLHHIVDLTPDGPLLKSTTPGRLHVWRYSHWLWVNDELWAYAEVERPNGSHEIRLFRIPRAPS